jgi:hypothetical protein
MSEQMISFWIYNLNCLLPAIFLLG